MTPLERALRDRIATDGSISVEAYMQACNAYYYATRDPLGVGGDFTTAPEISQMFGELIGVWVAAAWALMVVISLIGAVAHYALIKALDYAEAGAVQPYSYTLLVWATMFGWLVFGDVPDNWTILGAAIVVASGLYTWHRDRISAAKP